MIEERLKEKSLYRTRKTYFEEKSEFDYKNGFIERYTSDYLLSNPIVFGFLKKLESILIELNETVKKIRIFENYTVDKDYKGIE